jgi:hypothetical protein
VIKEFTGPTLHEEYYVTTAANSPFQDMLLPGAVGAKVKQRLVGSNALDNMKKQGYVGSEGQMDVRILGGVNYSKLTTLAEAVKKGTDSLSYTMTTKALKDTDLADLKPKLDNGAKGSRYVLCVGLVRQEAAVNGNNGSVQKKRGHAVGAGASSSETSKRAKVTVPSDGDSDEDDDEDDEMAVIAPKAARAGRHDAGKRRDDVDLDDDDLDDAEEVDDVSDKDPDEIIEELMFLDRKTKDSYLAQLKKAGKSTGVKKGGGRSVTALLTRARQSHVEGRALVKIELTKVSTYPLCSTHGRVVCVRVQCLYYI